MIIIIPAGFFLPSFGFTKEHVIMVCMWYECVKLSKICVPTFRLSRIFIKWRRVFTVFIFFQYSVIYNQYRLRKMMIQKKQFFFFIIGR